MATTPAPTPTPTKSTSADVWAFRSFYVLFFLTLIIGLLNYLLSWLKYKS